MSEQHRTPRTEARMRAVLAVLRSYGDACFPMRETLAERCGMPKSTLNRILARLKEMGLLKTELRGPTSCLYFISKKSESEKAFGKASGKARPRHLFTEEKQKTTEEASFAEILPTVENEYGRRVPNPEYELVQRVLRAARPRIERARSPVAYERHILRVELAAFRAQLPERRPPRGEYFAEYEVATPGG